VSFSWQRVVSWVVALGVGLVYGAAGTIAHAYRLGWFPLGLILALVGVAALLVAVRALTADRWATLACGVGLVVATWLFSGSGPGGSVIVPSGKLDSLGGVNLGIVWSIAVPVIVAALVLWPSRSGRSRRADNLD
jgi:hypothetical protein